MQSVTPRRAGRLTVAGAGAAARPAPRLLPLSKAAAQLPPRWAFGVERK